MSTFLTPLAAAPDARRHDHLLVRVRAERFAVPLAAVEEAVEAPEAVALPGLAAHCLGALRWRDRHLPLHDAAPVFGWTAARPVGAALVIGAGGQAAIAVDELLDVVELLPHAVRPWSGREDPHRVVAGVTRHDGALVAVVRPDGMLLACGAAAPAGCA